MYCTCFAYLLPTVQFCNTNQYLMRKFFVGQLSLVQLLSMAVVLYSVLLEYYFFKAQFELHFEGNTLVETSTSETLDFWLANFKYISLE